MTRRTTFILAALACLLFVMPIGGSGARGQDEAPALRGLEGLNPQYQSCAIVEFSQEYVAARRLRRGLS